MPHWGLDCIKKNENKTNNNILFPHKYFANRTCDVVVICLGYFYCRLSECIHSFDTQYVQGIFRLGFWGECECSGNKGQTARALESNPS